MMQRLDKLRKYAFASVLILGKDRDNCITGIWIMRGQQLAFDVSCLNIYIEGICCHSNHCYAAILRGNVFNGLK